MRKFKIPILLVLILMSLFACEFDPIEPVDSRDKFVGQWICTETSSLYGLSTYNVEIEKSVIYDDEILISNFYQLGASNQAEGRVTLSNVYLFDQTIDGNEITGSADYFSGNTTIDFAFTVYDGSDIDTVTAIYSK